MLARYPGEVAAHLLRWLGNREEYLKA